MRAPNSWRPAIPTRRCRTRRDMRHNYGPFTLRKYGNRWHYNADGSLRSKELSAEIVGAPLFKRAAMTTSRDTVSIGGETFDLASAAGLRKAVAALAGALGRRHADALSAIKAQLPSAKPSRSELRNRAIVREAEAKAAKLAAPAWAALAKLDAVLDEARALDKLLYTPPALHGGRRVG